MRRMATAAATLLLAACGSGADATSSPGEEASSAPAPASAQATPARAAVRSESRRFRDWYAVCDNGDDCVAYVGGSTGWIRIGLSAGPNAEPDVRVGMWPSEGPGATVSIDLVVDGRRHPTRPGPADTSSGVIPAARARTVVAELAAGRAVSLTSGGETVEIPAAGASASLLWIDERQGRLDTTTALIRRGSKPASAVPAAPALPVVAAAPAVAQTGFSRATGPADAASSNIAPPAVLEAVPAVKQCRENTAFNEYVGKAVTAARLDASTELWGVPCDSGAYNVMYAFFLTGPGGTNARPVRFTGLEDVAATDASGWLVNPGYDPATRTMSAFAKGRGLGDCGVAQSWIWTGRAFVLSREQVMSDCFGMVLDLWPTTFRSR